jgi:hypothetical protein
MNDSINKRIARAVGTTNLVELLSDQLSGADLHSLLLQVLKRRLSKIELQTVASASPVTNACNLDGRLLQQVEHLQCKIASDHEAVELSPLNPLGALFSLTGLDQANVLSTIRSFECTSDPTLGMALECARRRKQATARKDVTRLCTSQRVVRFPLPTNPAYTAHFKLFCLVTAGRDTGSFAFELNALREHIEIYLLVLAELRKSDFIFQEVMVEISDMRVVAHLCSHANIDAKEIRSVVRARDSSSSDKLLAQHSVTWPKVVTDPVQDLKNFDLPDHLSRHLALLEEQVLKPLRKISPAVSYHFNLQRLTGLGYYRGPCFHIKAKNAKGDIYTLADGGFVDWTQKLLSDDKERLMTSAIGTEQLCRMFRRQED